MKNFVNQIVKEVNNPQGKIDPTEHHIPSNDISELKQRAILINDKLDILDLVEPRNLDTVKKQWINHAQCGYFSNPQFDYDDLKLIDIMRMNDDVNGLYSDILNAHPKSAIDHFTIQMLLFLVEDISKTIKIAESILDRRDSITAKIVAEKYGQEIPENYSRTNSNSTQSIKKSSDRLSDTAFCLALFNAQVYYNFHWSTVLCQKTTTVEIRDKSANGPCIIVPISYSPSKKSALRLTCDIIESRIRCSENGVELFGWGGKATKLDKNILCEGLVTLSDEDFCSWSGDHYPGPNSYFIEAIELALQGKSFAEVAKYLYNRRHLEQYSLEKAFDITARVFRGITDTKNFDHYAFTKDIEYFNGYVIANELRQFGLEWLLELGNFSEEQLILIAQTFKLNPNIIPFKKVDLKEQKDFCKNLL